MGSYQYTAGDDTWQWSGGVYAIHGFHRGEVVPTTALLLSHAHAADRRQAGQVLRACLRDGKLFSLLVGQPVTDPACGLRAMRSGVTAAVTLEQPRQVI